MSNREDHRRKLLVEISRLKDDLRLLQQEDDTKNRGVRMAEVEIRLRGLIARLEAYNNG